MAMSSKTTLKNVGSMQVLPTQKIDK